MTAENYREVRRMHDSPAVGYVCMLGALDLISDVESVSPQMYEWYDQETRRLIAEPSSRGVKDAFNTVLGEIGKTMLRNVTWHSIESENHLEAVLDGARQGGRRPLMYIAANHVVGLRAQPGNSWTLHGTSGPWPVNARETVGIAQIYPLLQPKSRFIRSGKSYKKSNLIIFPAENKGRGRV